MRQEDIWDARAAATYDTPGTGTPHRYIWPAELDLMARLAGFARESRHADWTGGEFTAGSRSHVTVYRLTGS